MSAIRYEATAVRSDPGDKPMRAMVEGEIGVITAVGSPTIISIGDYVIAALHEVCYPQRGCYGDKIAEGYRVRPLSPGESVTFTRTKG